MFILSKGSLKRIVEGTNVQEPIMQITSLKSIQNNMDGQTRYKLTLYDGETSHTFGILATQKNYLVDDNELRVGSVIKMMDYAANVLQKDPPKVVIILVNFDILGDMPTGGSGDSDASSSTAQPKAQTAQYQSKPIQNENAEPNKPPPPQAKSFYNNANNKTESSTAANKPLSACNQLTQMFNNLKIYGISSLNPYQNKWAIKARVTNKSSIRTYTNAKGEGKLFNVELIDNTGEIRANGFNEQCDKFYDLLQIDHVYFISRGVLKTANKQYSKLNNDYELTFSNDTVIEPCPDEDNSLPHMNLDLVKLNDLPHKNANDFVDIMAVVKSTSDATTIVAKATNRELKKRDICLVDDSKCAVTCTLWGKQAEDFDGNENPVVLLKGAKVSDFGGRSLSVTSSTVFQINPDMPQSHALRGWFDSDGGSDIEYQDLSHQTGGAGSQGGATAGAGSASFGTVYKTLDKTKDEQLGMGDKADYFTTRAYILYAKKDNAMYMACPGDNCNKKVVDQNDGTYRCEKCARNYANFNWRLILSINIADFSESNWATCFQETAETILGLDANRLGELKNTNNPEFDEVFANCVFKQFNFKLRAKMETYNDERRVKISAVSVEPVDYLQSAKSLLQNIRAYAKHNIC